MAIAIAAGVTATASLASSAVSASASGKAASAQTAAAQNQIQLQQQEFNQEQQNEAPYMAAGNTALQQLSSGFGANGQFTQQFNPGTFQQTPQYAGYQFQQTQGNSAINANAAAKGESLSPATAQALSSYNQGLAATDYQSWYNNAYSQWNQQQQQQVSGLETIAGMGQGAVQGVNQAGQTATAGESSAEGSIGNAQAAGILGTASAISSGINGVAGAASGAATNSYYANLFNNGVNSSLPSNQQISNASTLNTSLPTTSPYTATSFNGP